MRSREDLIQRKGEAKRFRPRMVLCGLPCAMQDLPSCRLKSLVFVNVGSVFPLVRSVVVSQHDRPRGRMVNHNDDVAWGVIHRHPLKCAGGFRLAPDTRNSIFARLAAPRTITS